MRIFRITDKYVGNSGVLRSVVNFRWTRRTGLQCEMWRDVWVKSSYSLREFLAGMEGGHFIEVIAPANVPNFCESCAMDLLTCDCVNSRPVYITSSPTTPAA